MVAFFAAVMLTLCSIGKKIKLNVTSFCDSCRDHFNETCKCDLLVITEYGVSEFVFRYTPRSNGGARGNIMFLT